MNRSLLALWGAPAIAVALATGATAWLWAEYQTEVGMHQKVLVVRGEGMLTALEAGIRSHRRMGAWFEANIDSLLEETVVSPGIRGLAVFDESGACLFSVGNATGSLEPVDSPLWLGKDVLISRKFAIPEESAEWGGGRGQRGWRWRSAESGASDSSNEPQVLDSSRPILGDENHEREIQLVALMDGTEIQSAIGSDIRRFALSLIAAWLAISLGWITFFLYQRKARLSEQLIVAKERADHLEQLNQLAAGLAHETKNPLNIIRGMAQSCLIRTGGDRSIQETARRIVDESDRLVGRINGFLAYSRPKTVELREVDIKGFVLQVAALFRDEASMKGVDLRVDSEDLRVMADSDMFRQILVNLLTNSLDATGQGDHISVTVSTRSPHSASLEVSDTGCGISKEDLTHLCEPYFSRREGGTGLGLSIVNQLVAAHHWKIQFDSSVGEGMRVRMDGLVKVGDK